MPSLQESVVRPSGRGFTAAAWLFPIKGIKYFATHRFLWPLLRARIVPCMILSFIVYFCLFMGAYLPQASILMIFHGKGAWVNAAFLVLGEGAAITALLFEALLADDTQAKIFDAVLVNEGHEDLVTSIRTMNPDEADPVKCLGRQVKSVSYAPFSLRQIVEFILLLPLNFVPGIGVPLFLWLTGYRAGPLQHHRYFKMRDFNRTERNADIKTRRLSYTSFGCVALVLQLIPVLSMLFLLTTAAGSALWACQVEDIRKSSHVSSDDHHDEDNAAPPPYEYTDDPV